MIPLLQKTKILNLGDRKAIIEVSSLYPGYGITLGNALRRVLLSSLEGAAITSFRITGVPHEFSTIDGVYEDVLEISLNLKRVRFKIFSEEPQILKLSAKGAKKVTAADIALNPMVTVVNPETHIATLTDDKASLEMELTVEKGVGYSPAEKRRRKGKLPIGTIELDANFSPIVRVNFVVENMMVGERTDYNRLRLEVETDGSIKPVDAFDRAIDILLAQFQSLRLLKAKQESEETQSTFAVLNENGDIKSIALDQTKLSARTANLLAKHHIKTIGDLEKKTWNKLRELKGLGEKGIQELEKLAKEYGLSL